MKLQNIDKFVIERIIDTAVRDITVTLLAEYKGTRGILKNVDSGMDFAHQRGQEASQAISNYFKNKTKDPTLINTQ